MFGKKDFYDYDDIYDEEDSRNYEEFLETEDPDDILAEMRGTVSKGACCYCGEDMAMTYEGNICFVCSKCKRSIHEDLYYLWLAGYDIESDDYDIDDEDEIDDEEFF